MAALVLTLAVPSHALAQGVFYSTKEILKDFFRSSDKVTYEKVTGVSRLQAALGYTPAKDSYVVFIGQTGDEVDGFAVIDDELGQHQPISFAVKLTPDGRVERTEVMVYREGYGDEIREERFRRQFVGKGPDDPLRFGADIVAVSGATISSKSMSVAVRRAVALVDLLRRRDAASGGPSSATGAAR